MRVALFTETSEFFCKFIVIIRAKFISNINFSLTQIFFADNYSFHLKSNNPQRSHKLLPNSIESIEDWSSKHGFQLWTNEIELMIFQHEKIKSIFPLVSLSRKPILQPPSVKVLGLYVETWLQHINKTKAKCIRNLSFLIYTYLLSHASTGRSKRLPIQFYQTLVRSIHDRCSSIYRLVSPSDL